MAQWGKMIATAIMWLGCTGIGITALLMAPAITTVNVVPIVLGPLLMAMIATGIMWSSKADSDTKRETEKAKRQAADPVATVELLEALMDPEELAAFKEQLRQRALRDARLNDGELVEDTGSLADLLREDASRR
jgi:hypothetical protein